MTFKPSEHWCLGGGTSFILGWLAFALACLRKIKPLPVSESGDQTH